MVKKKYLLFFYFIFMLVICCSYSFAVSSYQIQFTPFALDITTNNQPTITGIATSDSLNIVSIECRIDSGSWESATPIVGQFDSKTESFSFRPSNALYRSADTHTIEARCKDTNGDFNSSNSPSYSFYVIGDRPEMKITSNGNQIIGGDPIDRNPSFEVLIITNKGLITYPIIAYIDNANPENLDKHTDPNNTGIIRASYNPLLSDGIHSLKVQATDNSSNITTTESIGLVVQYNEATSIQGTAFPYPNPYTGTGTIMIGYILSENSNVILTIHNLMGNQLVKKTYSSGQTGGKAGYNEVEWNAKTDTGIDVGNGIYIFLLIADGKVVFKGKLTVAR